MKFINNRKLMFKKSKKLPLGTMVIITKNNQEELPAILHHLTEHPIFKQGRGKILIVDHYSYDNTINIAKEYTKKYQEKIKIIKKVPKRTDIELIKPYLTKQFVEIINLNEIYKYKRHLPPEKIAEWSYSLRKIVKSNTSYDAINVIHRMEEERQNIYDSLKNTVLESLAHIEMILKENKGTKKVNERQDIMNLLDKTIGRMQALIKRFDTGIFEGYKLYPNISSLLKDFTERTQITSAIKETGKERDIEPFFGLSILRMIQEALEYFERVSKTTHIEIRIRWQKNKLILRMKDNASNLDWRKMKLDDLKLIDERTNILGGYFKVKNNKFQNSELIIALPIYEFLGEQHENNKKS